MQTNRVLRYYRQRSFISDRQQNSRHDTREHAAARCRQEIQEAAVTSALGCEFRIGVNDVP